MFVLGLTGGIGSGKGRVAELLRQRGAVVVDADAIARELVQPGQPLLAELVGGFGPGILRSDGALDREGLARLVFADPQAREQLDRITHPPILRAIRARLEELRGGARPPELVVAVMPLLFEAGAQDLVDKVLVVYADPEERVRRIVQRDGLSAEEARVRIEAQMPADEQLRRADFTLDTTGSFEDTDRRFARLWPRLLRAVRAGG